MTMTIFNVPDISCEHCEHTISRALSAVAGVDKVEVDISAKQVAVVHDEASVTADHLKDVLEQEDYPVESIA